MPAVTVDEAVGRVLRAFGLSPAAVSPIGEGLVNDNWSVEAAGRRWVLRRYSVERAAKGIPFEHEVLARLGAVGWPVAVPYAAPDGSTLVNVEGRYHALFPHLPGRRLDDPARHGAVLAQLHLSTASLSIGTRPSWPRLADYARPPFGELVFRYAAADPEGAAQAVLVHGRTAATLAAAPPDLPTLVVHGDFHTGNLLFDERGDLTGVLDFDFARTDLRAVDVAVALGFLTTDADRAGFLAGYEAAIPLLPAERALLPALQAARRLELVAFSLRRWAAGDAAAPTQVRAALAGVIGSFGG